MQLYGLNYMVASDSPLLEAIDLWNKFFSKLSNSESVNCPNSFLKKAVHWLYCIYLCILLDRYLLVVISPCRPFRLVVVWTQILWVEANLNILFYCCAGNPIHFYDLNVRFSGLNLISISFLFTLESACSLPYYYSIFDYMKTEKIAFFIFIFWEILL